MHNHTQNASYWKSNKEIKHPHINYNHAKDY